MQAVNTDADFLTRHAAQMPSRFHDAAKILLNSVAKWTLNDTESHCSRGLEQVTTG